MVNQSKINDPRFWNRWRESGAVNSLVGYAQVTTANIMFASKIEDWRFVISAKKDETYLGLQIKIRDLPIVLQSMAVRQINAYDPNGTFLRELGLSGCISVAQMDPERKFPYFGELERRMLPVIANSKGEIKLGLTGWPPRYYR